MWCAVFSGDSHVRGVSLVWIRDLREVCVIGGTNHSNGKRIGGMERTREVMRSFTRSLTAEHTLAASPLPTVDEDDDETDSPFDDGAKQDLSTLPFINGSAHVLYSESTQIVSSNVSPWSRHISAYTQVIRQQRIRYTFQSISFLDVFAYVRAQQMILLTQ
ncbi:unnamed protein product [Sphagnum balticum]